MSKRGPTSELNHDNWDKEDAEKERAGEFKQADTDEIKKRVILQAKRKTTSSSVTDVAKTPFGNFKGFSSTPANKPNFNFIVAPSDSKSPSVTSSNGTAQPKLVEKSSSEYFHQLKSLNVSVSAWIAKHVDSNPFCILTPVFKDYEKHLANIESKRLPSTPADVSAPNNLELETKTSPKTEEDVKVGSSSTNANLLDNNQRKSETENTEAEATITIDQTKTNSFAKIDVEPAIAAAGELDEESRQEDLPATSTASSIFGSIGSASTFSFGSTKPATTATSTSFVFGNTGSSATSLFGNTGATNSNFSFGGFAKPGAAPTSTFSFGNTGTSGFGGFGSYAPKPAESANDEAEENEEPPKVEFKAVAEENSVYEIKCKMFVMKDKEYVERGLGQLYIKKQDSDCKAQLLVRSASATGQILLNVLLIPSIEPKRLGKNNVQLACIAMPGDATPSIVMIRVKTGEDADELVAKIDEFKK